MTGEFWYELKLNAEKPRPVALPHMVAELGKTVRTQIPITNDTPDTSVVHITLSNSPHFVLHSQVSII